MQKLLPVLAVIACFAAQPEQLQAQTSHVRIKTLPMLGLLVHTPFSAAATTARLSGGF
jgi:hypothetical protein